MIIDYSQMLHLRDELSLTVVLLLVLLFDLFAPARARRWFQTVACGLVCVHAIGGLFPMEGFTLFGGM